jgi:hypothetical protein
MSYYKYMPSRKRAERKGFMMAASKQKGFVVTVLIKNRDIHGIKTQKEIGIFVTPLLAKYLDVESWSTKHQGSMMARPIKREFKEIPLKPIHFGEYWGCRIKDRKPHEDSIGSNMSNMEKLIKLCELKSIPNFNKY